MNFNTLKFVALKIVTGKFKLFSKMQFNFNFFKTKQRQKYKSIYILFVYMSY